jgi:hypothetical protein
VCKRDFVLFVNVDASFCPVVIASFKVWPDMHVQLFDGRQQLNIAELGWLLGAESKFSRWSQLPNACAHLQNVCRPSQLTVDSLVQSAVNNMKQLVRESKQEGNSRTEQNLKFLIEQFQLLYSQ